MKIVVCGSMSASKKMVEVGAALASQGHEVVLPHNAESYANGELQAENSYESTNNKIERDLIRSYFQKIKEADAVLVVNCDKGDIKNYVGGNSFLEAGFAYVLNKKLYFLNELPNLTYCDELAAFQPVILNGDLSLLK